MVNDDLSQVRSWLLTQLQQASDEAYRQKILNVAPGMQKALGVPVPEIRRIAKEAKKRFDLSPYNWSRFISLTIIDGSREEVIAGAVALGKKAGELDDLFGERASGWGRALTNWEITDQLACAVGYWVLADLSRVGYLEAWANIGENIWKQRMGIVSTVQLNHGGHSYPAETFRVLRHRMETTEPTLIKALGWAIREVKDIEQVERFLAWWAPRIQRSLMTEASKKLPEKSRKRLKNLLTS